LIQMKLSYL